MRVLPLIATVICMTAPFKALTQDLLGYESSSFGDIVLSKKQAAVGGRLEAAVGQYNNEYIQNYSENSVFASLGRAVGRLDILTDKGNFPCTAFIVSERHILTNHHCVPGILEDEQIGAEQIRAVGFVAGYVRPGVQEGAQFFQVVPLPVETNAALDYSVLEVIGNPSAEFGMLELSGSEPAEGDPYWIIGHPMGEAQRISREKCRANSPAVSGGRLLHTCDTLPGNSGSPLIDASQRRVVGLHHAGSEQNSVNFAIPMKQILEQSQVLQATDQKPAPSQPSANAGSGGQCDALYSEAKSMSDCIGYEAYLSRCTDHVFAPFAQTFMKRHCSVSDAGQSVAAVTPNPDPDVARKAVDICLNGQDPQARVKGCTDTIQMGVDAETLRDAYLIRAEYFLISDAPDKALADLKDAGIRGAEDSPHGIAYLVLRGDALNALGRYADAVPFFEAALQEDSRARIWNGLALAYAGQDRPNLASEKYLRAAFNINTTAEDRQITQRGLNALGGIEPHFALPEDLVARFYDVGPAELADDYSIGGINSDNPYLSPALVELLERDENRAFALLDFDPIVDGQDALITDVSINWQMRNEGGSVGTNVEATFNNFNEPVKLVYVYGPIDDTWKLMNIVSPEWNLYEILSAEPPGANAPFHSCDAATAHKDDPQSVTTGVAFRDIDPRFAIEQCLEATSRYPNSPRFKFQLGRAYDKDEQFVRAFDLYQSAAQQNYAQAMFAMAIHHENGDSVELNLDGATHWYEAAAMQGHVKGMYEAALLYEKAQDRQSAIRWFRSAAREGFASAQFKYALYLEGGWGVERDYQEARFWYEAAAENGSANAMGNLSTLYERGQGGPRDHNLAGQYLYLAIERGNETALANILRKPVAYERETIQTVQSYLFDAGLYFGAIDGVIGPGTETALRALSRG